MELLNNPWIIGIGTSVLSGIIVFFITKKFISRKEDREYRQRVKTANNAILYAFRPLIVNKKLPSKHIIDSIFSSISKEHHVDLKDIYRIDNLSNDLVSEIMSNAFLSTEQKLEFCELLKSLKTEYSKNIQDTSDNRGISNKRPEVYSYLSGMMALMSVVITLTFVFKEYLYYENTSFTTKFADFLEAGLIAVFIPLLVLIIMDIFRKYIRIRKYGFSDKTGNKDK